jgi:carboxyl-terminal processing protease
MKKILLAITATLCASSLAGAQKYIGSPAQDLFDQTAFYFDTQYFGPSTINIADLITKYQIQVDELCAEQKEKCEAEKIEPLLAQMFAEFKDDHTYYLSAAAVRNENANRSGAATSPTPRVGISLQNFCDTPTGDCTQDAQGNLTSKIFGDRLIANVVNGGPADKAGIRYGDRWLGYNDTLFAKADGNLTELNKLYTEFTNKIRAGESVKMILVRGSERQKIEINLKGEIITTSEQPKLELRTDGVAVITLKDYQIRGVGQKLHDLVREAVSKGAKAIIYNERDNGGGSVLETIAAAGAFAELPVVRWVTRYNPERNSFNWSYVQGRVSAKSMQGAELTSLSITNPVLFQGPVAVLVNGGCASGCEVFASYLQKTKRAPVIGTPTLGIGNTNTARFGLINGGAAGMPTIQSYWADGTRMPATVQPDILTPNFEYQMFNTGRDAPMEKALESVGVKTLQTNIGSVEIKVPFAPIPTFGFDAIQSALEQLYTPRKSSVVSSLEN